MGKMMFGGPPPPLSKRVFDKYDRDKSGFISPHEFKDMCYELGYFLSDDELTVAVKNLDRDGKNHIAYEEFSKWWKSDDRFKSLQLTEAEEKTLQVCVKYFQHFDKNRDGTISAEEFKELHPDLVKNKLTTKPIDTCLADLDEDGSGTVCFHEYIEWLIKIGSVKVKVIHSDK